MRNKSGKKQLRNVKDSDGGLELTVIANTNQEIQRSANPAVDSKTEEQLQEPSARDGDDIRQRQQTEKQPEEDVSQEQEPDKPNNDDRKLICKAGNLEERDLCQELDDDKRRSLFGSKTGNVKVRAPSKQTTKEIAYKNKESTSKNAIPLSTKPQRGKPVGESQPLLRAVASSPQLHAESTRKNVGSARSHGPENVGTPRTDGPGTVRLSSTASDASDQDSWHTEPRQWQEACKGIRQAVAAGVRNCSSSLCSLCSLSSSSLGAPTSSTSHVDNEGSDDPFPSPKRTKRPRKKSQRQLSNSARALFFSATLTSDEMSAVDAQALSPETTADGSHQTGLSLSSFNSQETDCSHSNPGSSRPQCFGEVCDGELGYQEPLDLQEEGTAILDDVFLRPDRCIRQEEPPAALSRAELLGCTWENSNDGQLSLPPTNLSQAERQMSQSV